MRKFKLVYLLVLLTSICVSCRKIDHSSVSDASPGQGVDLISGEGGGDIQLTNANLLNLVLSGSGGVVLVDSTCDHCPIDTVSSYRVTFPRYTPPTNIGNMLSFSTEADYNNFVIAANLMQSLWKNSEMAYEDTPLEVYYLGEESFNAFDSAMSFQSLRSLYELSDFNDENWRDTLGVYVEDDDKQIVLNDLSEVKIGSKYYKYVTDNLMAEIGDLATLDSVRLWGVLATQGNNLRFYDEQYNTITPLGEWLELVQGCNDFNLNLVGHFTSYVNPTSNKWTIGTMVRNPVINTNSTQNKNIKANYTVDWGDGVVQTFVGYFGLINYFTHIYQYPSSGFINRNITVSCQIIPQSNPSQAYLNVLANCPSVTSTIFTSSTVIKLETFNYPDCLGGRIVREFAGIEHTVGGTRYRVDCKLKQVSTHSGFIVAWQQAKIATTVVFRKFHNNRWKKTKSIGWLCSLPHFRTMLI
jgi:hypothetical protein